MQKAGKERTECQRVKVCVECIDGKRERACPMGAVPTTLCCSRSMLYSSPRSISSFFSLFIGVPSELLFMYTKDGRHFTDRDSASSTESWSAQRLGYNTIIKGGGKLAIVCPDHFSWLFPREKKTTRVHKVVGRQINILFLMYSINCWTVGFLFSDDGRAQHIQIDPHPPGICMCGVAELIAWKPWRQYDKKFSLPTISRVPWEIKYKKGLDVPTQSSARPVSRYKVDNGEKQSTIKIFPTVHSDRPSEFIQASTSWRLATTTTTTTQKGNYDCFFIFVVVGSSSRSALPAPSRPIGALAEAATVVGG